MLPLILFFLTVLKRLISPASYAASDHSEMDLTPGPLILQLSGHSPLSRCRAECKPQC